MVVFCHAGDHSGLSKLHPCYLVPIILAGLRAQPQLDHLNLIGTDLDIYTNAAVDVQEHMRFLMPVKATLHNSQEENIQVGMYWFSEVRLRANAGRLVCPAVRSSAVPNPATITKDSVQDNIGFASKQVWEGRLTLQELNELFQQKTSKEATPAHGHTYLSFHSESHLGILVN